MASKKTTDNPDELTPEQAAARAAGDPVEVDEPVEVTSGDFTDTVLHGGVEYPRGTDSSKVKPKLTADQRERLTDLGLIAD